MPLPSPNLDNRDAQSIVDEAKKLITQYCPEWTDHNVSDPGIALIELFAWMTDMMIYRVNQVPEKMYVKFLELIGVNLIEPRPATAPVTFYLSSPLKQNLSIQSIEFATPRTETSEPVVFSNRKPIELRVPSICHVIGRNESRSAFVTYDVSTLSDGERNMPVFPPRPAEGDAFYLGFDNDLSNHVLSLSLSCREAEGEGVRLDHIPIKWSVSRGSIGPLSTWAPCALEKDETRGFNVGGVKEIVLRLPEMTQTVLAELGNRVAYWLKCEIVNGNTADTANEDAHIHEKESDGTVYGDERQIDTAGSDTYTATPIIDSLTVNTKGGTVFAQNATVHKNEILGRSSGSPGQSFKLLNTPVLRPFGKIIVENPDAPTDDEWSYVDSFSFSQPNDKHYTLVPSDGTITFGPTLYQPNGKAVRFGAVPKKGSLIRMPEYFSCGGIRGNVAPKTIVDLRSANIIAHPNSGETSSISSVINYGKAEGGTDVESIDHAKLRVPRFLGTRVRAVTTRDHEYLACEVARVARAKCIGPNVYSANSDPPAGTVYVYVLPKTNRPHGYMSRTQLELASNLKSEVEQKLNQYAVLGVKIDVRPPTYRYVAVDANVVVPANASQGMMDQISNAAQEELYAYLNPYSGGPDGTGWPFGRSLSRSEIYAVLQRVPHIEFIRDITIRDGDVTLSDRDSTVDVGPGELICSDIHSITPHRRV